MADMDDLTPAAPWLQAEVDQASAAVRDGRADMPAARQEQRCVAPPMGCGQPLPARGPFRDDASYREYGITGLCQVCQDRDFGIGYEDDDVALLDQDEEWGRCPRCGFYRPMEHVDVGVGVISGFNCCYLSDDRTQEERAAARCRRTTGCRMDVGHAHHCYVPPPPPSCERCGCARSEHALGAERPDVHHHLLLPCACGCRDYVWPMRAGNQSNEETA